MFLFFHGKRLIAGVLLNGPKAGPRAGIPAEPAMNLEYRKV
jgi:hypothetical protein